MKARGAQNGRIPPPCPAALLAKRSDARSEANFAGRLVAVMPRERRFHTARTGHLTQHGSQFVDCRGGERFVVDVVFKFHKLHLAGQMLPNAVE